ncbi:hypothetical protein ACB092_05G240900, partial [Castanea dentata]
LKICCGVTAILLITFIVVMIILYFTILKPKNPEITSQPGVLEHYELMVIPAIKLNVSLGIVVTVNNRNYGGFEYQNSTTYVTYRGDVVAEAPIQADTIPARRKHNISTTVIAIILKVFKKKATSDCTCDTSLFLGNVSSHSDCKSTVKF